MSGTNCPQDIPEDRRDQRGSSTEISTSKLNDIIQEALDSYHLPVFRGKQVRIYYATQTARILLRSPSFPTIQRLFRIPTGDISQRGSWLRWASRGSCEDRAGKSEKGRADEIYSFRCEILFQGIATRWPKISPSVRCWR